MIKAVIFDIYGTLLRLKVGDLDESILDYKKQICALRKIKKKYKIKEKEETVLKCFIDEIKADHLRNRVKYPEVVIEKVWGRVFRKLGVKGIDVKKFAYDYYDLCDRRSLYSGVKEILSELKKGGVKIGIISNAQFYTSIDMSRLLKRSMYDYFDKRLVFYSFKEGCSKPNQKSFRLLKKKLGKIKNKEVLFVGNHMVNDIDSANKAGFLSCLTLNDETVMARGVKTDYKISNLREIMKIINSD